MSGTTLGAGTTASALATGAGALEVVVGVVALDAGATVDAAPGAPEREPEVQPTRPAVKRASTPARPNFKADSSWSARFNKSGAAL
jgi:hypothetical protein